MVTIVASAIDTTFVIGSIVCKANNKAKSGKGAYLSANSIDAAVTTTVMIKDADRDHVNESIIGGNCDPIKTKRRTIVANDIVRIGKRCF